MIIWFIGVTANAELSLLDNQINEILVMFPANVDTFIIFQEINGDLNP